MAVYDIIINSQPFLFRYTGKTSDLPAALTNIGPAGLNIVVTVWGIVNNTWVSYDAEFGAGSLRKLVQGEVYQITHTGNVGTIWQVVPPTTPTPTPTGNEITISAQPFMFYYHGITSSLPEILTNIGPSGLNIVVTVWGVIGTEWWSYDAEFGAGYLRELEHGKCYIITHTGTVGTVWNLGAIPDGISEFDNLYAVYA